MESSKKVNHFLAIKFQFSLKKNLLNFQIEA